MRSAVLVLSLVLVGAVARADGAGFTLVHEGRLLDGSDVAVDAASLAAKFEIFAEKLPDSAQVPLWTGSCTVTVTHGLYATTLGGECGTNLTADALPYGATRYLQVSIGGVMLLPRQRLGIVPMSAVAGNALTVGGKALGELWTKAEGVNAATLGGKAAGDLWAKSEGVNAATLGGKALTEVWTKADGVNAATLENKALSELWTRTDAVDAATLGGKSLDDLDGRYVKSAGGGAGAVTIAGALTVASVSGDGHGLTNLDAAQLSGTVPGAKLPANLARLDQAQTFTGQPNFGAGLRLGNDATACGGTNAGALRYTGASLDLCIGGTWTQITLGRLGSQTNPARSCKVLLQGGGSVGDGVYWVDADGAGSAPAYQAYCDMTTDGGGWTLVAYAGDNTAGFPRMDVDVGGYNPTSRVGKASKSAVAVARTSTEIALAFAPSVNFAGPMSQSTDAVSFVMPDPSIVDFVGSADNGTCTAVTPKRLKPDGSTRIAMGTFATNSPIQAGVWSKSLGGTYTSFAYGLFATLYSCNSWPDTSHKVWVDQAYSNWEPSATVAWPATTNGTAMMWLR